MIALVRFRRGTRRPDVTSVQRRSAGSDAALAREIARRAEGGRVVRVFDGRRILFEVVPNGLVWLVRPVPCRDRPVGTFLGVMDALRGGDAWVARRRSGECDEEDFLGGDDPRPAA